ncbi:MAG: hypothetical protein KC656_09105 [Myxococcales bacterium]|nr:hypothetical protein [Myxococcales bacterium]MCB9673095.1 hypothetical protein [Alphaproteobacteria bacterium]MCB9694952.1 hypothetical protein [Alphaproteobacteria bacterium]
MTQVTPPTHLGFEPVTTLYCSGGTVNLHPDGYVVSDLVPRTTQTWDTACEMLLAGASLAPGFKQAAIVITNESRTERDGRRAFAEVGAPLLSCVALIVRSRVSEVTGNFFLRLNRPAYPTRLFGSVEAAVEWVVPHVGQPIGPEGIELLERMR